ncbi:hypothetical protein DPMN_005616 [Dreissena polymorpha]|uniref:Uncharacterized protein n=1 Tax=Dreissena polymorpha TaxID=45954 RepID=A0A9D4MTM4_DREPO|nr:hypothetical protein DPMN_005616 [Dreissena polymorpha]
MLMPFVCTLRPRNVLTVWSLRQVKGRGQHLCFLWIVIRSQILLSRNSRLRLHTGLGECRWNEDLRGWRVRMGNQ